MNEDNYYDRTQGTHSDGSRVWQTRGDDAHEKTTAAILERAWRATLHRFPTLCPLDYYVEREQRLRAVVEIKARSCASTSYATSFLPVSKFTALTVTALALGCEAVYAVRYEDGVFWTPLSEYVEALETTVLRKRLPPLPQALVEIPLDLFRKVAP